jgi:hypothetical protein
MINMVNLIKIIKIAGLTALLTLTSCSYYRFTTMESCLTNEENNIENKVINYFQKADSTRSNQEDDLFYYIAKPDADNINLKLLKIIDF